MTRAEFLRIFQEKLELDPRPLTGQEVLQDTGFWDSLAAITFIALADEHCGREVAAEDLASCTTIDDLLKLLGDGVKA